ncbi:hypothetical protein CAC42_2900 [Sphaceloma murrayae]|uniref:Rhodopsin domain-containing protein n=1 Tax=Sphaceloma murrayae TaxID=2082308 RepID=A0A2K1R030_9PEZI|nr:hypothetical protein CAC42_2900 [Sphaceloma murrayae]
MPWIINGTAELDAQSGYQKIIASAVATSTLMLATVALRAYVRLRIVKSLGTDDWCILIAAITSLAYTVGGVVQTRYGLGLPPSLYLPQNQVIGFKLNYAFRFLYCISVSFFKFALCNCYLRITNNSSSMRTYRKVILGTMLFTFVFMLYYCAVVIFACTPIHKYWHRQIPGKCLPVPVVYYSPAVITIIVDVVLFLLPIPLVLPLRMNRRRKIGLIIAFLLGLITTVCSVLRLKSTIDVPRSGDPQRLIKWAIAEMNIGIVTTSLPVLAPLLKSSFLRKAQVSSTHSSRDRPIRSALAAKIPAFLKKPTKVVISSLKRSHTSSGDKVTDTAFAYDSDLKGSPKSSSGSDSERIFTRTESADFEHIPMPFISKTLDIDVISRPKSDDLETCWMKEEKRFRGA